MVAVDMRGFSYTLAELWYVHNKEGILVQLRILTKYCGVGAGRLINLKPLARLGDLC